MTTPTRKDTKRSDIDEEATFRCISATVRIATHALDGLSLSDEDVDGLCDAMVQDGFDRGRLSVRRRTTDTARATIV